MSQAVISIENITKQYYLEKPRTVKKWFNHFLSPFQKLTVIKNFSLQVNKGEFILLTGPNGSGKSTLLKLIAGITLPDKGSIRTQGRIVPLIELGAGFNFELTGKENIITNAAILGIEKSNLVKIIPEIINFSGLKNFIDIPLKRYSSGMVSRLAFSIAASSNPDILLLDEVLAVGDEKFRRKAMKKVLDFNKHKVTIIFSTNLDYSTINFSQHINLNSSRF